MAWGSASQRSSVSKASRAMHSKYGKGNQTAAQIAAERRNLAKARLKRHSGTGHGRNRYYHRAKYKFPHGATTSKARGNRGARFAESRMELSGKRRSQPLGTTRVMYRGKSTLTPKRPTGRIPKFQKSISSGAYLKRTSWQKTKSHHFKKVLRKKRPRQLRVGHWTYHKHSIRPR